MDTALVVHDVQVSDQTGFGLNNTIQTKTVVTFYVGTHGPFRLEYPKASATGEKIQNDINAQVALLSGITGATMSGTNSSY